MKLGILECGAPPAPLAESFGSYGGMIARLLDRETRSFAVKDGEFPVSPTECDAWILTGSAAGVYDDLEWIPRLLDFLSAARGRTPLVGICFGHQAMAQAFGGKVELSDKGWGIGLQRYEILQPAGWMAPDAGPAPQSIRAPASHQDQVVVPPPGARVIAGSAFTPYAALDYGDAISFQFHPEFSARYAIALIGTRRERYGALADAAIASYAGRSDGPTVATWINRFLAQHARV